MGYETALESAPELLVDDQMSATASQVCTKREYGFGIEEEYFLVHADTMQAVSEAPEAFFEELSARTSGRAGHESLQAQIEISTAPETSVAKARDELRALRKSSSDIAGRYGFAILASGTHPTAEWHTVAPTRSNRYFKVMDALQMIGRRNMLCGMHVHVELPDPKCRVDVMVRMLPYIPLFIALSTSSPFWHSRETGLKSYRLAAYDELPRSGMPELFANEEDYNRYVASLVAAGIIEDASYIWWTVRPSNKYPTLELRAPDCCTRLDDAISLACLFRVLARHLFRNQDLNSEFGAVGRCIAVENKWHAQRFGVEGVFASETGPVSVAKMLDDVIAITAEDASALGCSSEVERCRAIIADGTSAHKQLKIFREQRHLGTHAALKSVADWIARETLGI
jgi:carboxylate-amine ligase